MAKSRLNPEKGHQMTTDKIRQPRLFALDALRVFAIVMMIVYHFIYDLKYFGYVDWNTPNGQNFQYWRTAIVFGFVFAMGLSMGIAHGRERKLRAFSIRLGQILACALLITLVSFFMFPESWIYFGILHFMWLASLLTFTLVGKPWIAMGIGVAIVFSFWMGWVPYGWPFTLIPNRLPYTEDFASPFPWLGVALIGLSLGAQLTKNQSLTARLSGWKIDGAVGKTVSFAGKRSLSIYMLHQPVLFALIIAAGYLIRLVPA